MRIDSSSTSGIQSLASASIQSASPAPAAAANASPDPVSAGKTSAPSHNTADQSARMQADSSNKQGTFHSDDSMEDVFDSNLSEKLKDPEMQNEFNKVLDYASKLLFKNNSDLQFSIHEGTNTTLIKLVDSKTKEVLKEYPPEKLLNMIADLWERAGLVVNKKA